MTHFYKVLKDQQKGKDLDASIKQGGQPAAKGQDPSEKGWRPRGKNNSKAELK